MKIVVIGLRGFPNIQGGVETHCEELYTRLVQFGHEIIVVRRKGFVNENPPYKEYKGIKFKDINAPSISGFEAAVHTAKGILYAKKVRTDIIHIHAIGPSIMIPLAKLLGLKVVMTHHGPDYNREKWGFFAKSILKIGEWFAAIGANNIIAISTVITDLLKNKYNRTKHVHLIYNGFTSFPPLSENSTFFLQELDLIPNKYILAVGRFVEEKRFDKLIEAYIKLNRPDYKLVLVGDADYSSPYAHFLKNFAAKNNIITPGIIKGQKLHQIYQNAALFVLPSSHEGLPITLLEAMGCKRKVLASDIPANIAINLPTKNYFKLNDIQDMIYHINILLDIESEEQYYDLSNYNWDNIARQTNEVYMI